MKGMGADAFFGQSTDMTASQKDATSTSQLVKATFYLTPELVMKLEQIRFERLQRGERVDKSALVREAIQTLNS